MKPRSSLSPKLAILCNPALAGSCYVVVGAALDWVDPGSFLALETMFLLPVALGILLAALGTDIRNRHQRPPSGERKHPGLAEIIVRANSMYRFIGQR